jgi:hypothetical protein
MDTVCTELALTPPPPSAQRSTARTCAGHGRRNGSLRRVDTVLGLATIWRGFSAWHNQY